MINFKRPLLAATLVSVLAVTAACGDSDAGTTGTVDVAAVNQAKAAVAQLLKNPTGIELTEPVSKRPPTGKLIAVPESPQPVTHVKNLGIVEAGKALGWRVQVIPEGTGPEDAAKAFDQALALKPDAIVFSGTPVALLRAQLERAKAQGVPVLGESITDPVQPGIISTSLDGVPQVAQYGKMVGQYVAAHSGGKAHAAVFTISGYPILTTFTDNFRQALTSACPSCKVTVVNQQISDLGTKTPQSVVSTIQRDPSVNWAIFSIGDLTLGVPAALRAAGLTGKVKIGGETPSPANIAALKAGTEEVWTGFAATILGWRDVDMLVRHFNGDSLDTANTTLLPTQLITKDNVRSVPLDSNGYYVGYPGYADAFKKLWKIG
ncbi:sugar ABC transporter substrate-binding protein [Actinomadura rudentiformis]|uniref:Substrate-binding domain-containing protein n=1 Tax=Actinomadura rudentiformis TaxID=359158 RepID=A0A6H9Y8H4_9ACTN|nr:substrate-binding domain-containing protein [Actinomadura rudentiformis]KAB2340398.1 substrate-binding domain-containing protein [Actinomadura rudentiformis]